MMMYGGAFKAVKAYKSFVKMLYRIGLLYFVITHLVILLHYMYIKSVYIITGDILSNKVMLNYGVWVIDTLAGDVPLVKSLCCLLKSVYSI